MKNKTLGIGLLIILILLIAFYINTSANLNFLAGEGLGVLCDKNECMNFCSDNPFACEVYCVQHPNNYCKERFSFVYSDPSIGYPLLKFPEFREYPYKFEKGGIVEKEPTLQHIGVELDFFDVERNKAGDFVFSTFTYPWNSEVYNTHVFYDYGKVIQSNGTVKTMPEVTYILPLGTKVYALTDGIVVSIKHQDTGDYEMGIVKPENPSWTFGYDHIINLLVKEGDNVVAGQVIAEVSDYNKWLKGDGYGAVEVSLAYTRTSFVTHCPFAYLDESVKEDYFRKILALYDAWENYTKDTSAYSDKYDVPGCITTEPIDEQKLT